MQVLEQFPVLIQALTQPGKLVLVRALIRLKAAERSTRLTLVIVPECGGEPGLAPDGNRCVRGDDRPATRSWMP